jgi:hypothetical protein
MPMEPWQAIGVALIGALVPILLAIAFWRPLAARIAASHEFEFEWGNLKLRMKGSEADSVLQAFIQEMRRLVDKVPAADRRLVLTRVEANNGRVRVKDIYPGFQRDTPEHETLRGLRDGQFIRPIGSGRFHPDSLLEMKQFGRLMLQHQREYILPKELPEPGAAPELGRRE